MAIKINCSGLKPSVYSKETQFDCSSADAPGCRSYPGLQARSIPTEQINKKVEVAFVLTALLIGLIVRVWHFTGHYDAAGGDVSHDYLVAHHMVYYREVATKGPRNSVYDTFRNSPFYYYFIAAPLFIKDNIYTLAVFGVVLQLIAIIAAWWFTRILFGRLAALICLCIYLTSYMVIHQTDFMWQPWAAQPFFNLSYAAFAWGYIKKDVYAIFLSVLSFSLALGPGLWGIPTVPIYVVLVCFALYSMRAKPIAYTTILLCMIGLETVFYFTPARDHYFLTHAALVVPTNGTVQTPLEYIGNIPKNITMLFGAVLNLWNSSWVPQPVGAIAPYILMLFIISMLFVGKHKNNSLVWLLIVFVVQPLIAVSYLRVPTYPYTHYFVAVVGPLIVLLSYALATLLHKKGAFFGIGILMGLFITVLIVPDYHALQWRFVTSSNDREYRSVATWLFEALQKIQQKKRFRWEGYTNVVMYEKGGGISPNSCTIWNPLEQMSGTRLVRIVDDNDNYQPIIKDERIVVMACLNYDSVATRERECEQNIVKTYSGYTPEPGVYDASGYYIRIYTKPPSKQTI